MGPGVSVGSTVATGCSSLARRSNCRPSNIRLPSKRGFTGLMAAMESKAHRPSSTPSVAMASPSAVVSMAFSAALPSQVGETVSAFCRLRGFSRS